MLTILIALGLILLLLMVSVARANRRQREVAEAREQEAAAAQERGEDPSLAGSPFGMFPFGGLFGGMLSGPGAWSRSYTYDEETGRWVDVSDQDFAAPAEEPIEGRAEEASEAAAPRRRQASRSASPMGGLGGLLGGAMGGGMGGGGNFEVQAPEELHDFDEVGGMEDLKREIADTIGLMLEHPDDAQRYGIEWNGVLLYGPPGVGKTFFAKAIAGEYGLGMIHVSTGDLVAGIQGQSAQNIKKAFDAARDNIPCLLFFDEFDSVAQRRDNNPDQEARRTVNQLLTSLEAHRDERRLLVMAATNSIEHLDPAVIRPGRFDRHIRIDLPDADARREIFRAELDDRPAAPDIDLDDLVRRTEGMTPAAISKVVDTAALDIFKQAAETGEHLQLAEEHLLAAVARFGGEDRPIDRALELGLPDPAAGDQGAAPAAAGGDRGPRVRHALRGRAADRASPRRPSRHRQDHDREGPRRPGALLVLPGLRRRRDEQVGRRVGGQHPAALRARPREPALDRLHRRDRRPGRGAAEPSSPTTATSTSCSPRWTASPGSAGYS